MNKNLYSIGLMSGTSLDGIDVSIIKSNGADFLDIIDNAYLKYDNKVKSKLKKVIKECSSKDRLLHLSKKINEIEKEITILNAKAVQLIRKKNKSIKLDLIGFHGQTILHNPHKGYSIQIGDSNLLSKLTNNIVVSNFREKDILNGGQGAPLAPLYHKLILSKIKSDLPSAIINIGGISNITYVGYANKIFSFDTGPGNCLIDEWVKSKTNMEFDNDGAFAQTGNVNKALLNKFLKDPYYNKKSPKSLDVKYFDLTKLKDLNLKDGCTTLSMLTVNSICTGIKRFKKFPKNIILSGGGRKNKFIVSNLEKKLKRKINLIDDFNFNGDFIESQAFAYLAIRSYLNKYITLPTTTGVKKPCTGGTIFKN
jgi:anhydro-N-acetylmuramic acid kinase